MIEEFVDDGYSGARLDRPALDRLRDAAEAGVLEGMLCLCVDRLARAYAYQVLILDELQSFGVTVHFLEGPAPSDDPQATLLIQMQGVIAEYEKAKIAERYRRGKLYRARAGEIPFWKCSRVTGASSLPTADGRGSRSTRPRPRSSATSSTPTSSGACQSGRSRSSCSTARSRHRAASRSGEPPRSIACCATRPTSAPSTTTAPNGPRVTLAGG